MLKQDYTPMWKSLGINIEGHDRLLEVLGGAYRDIYLSQKNRPKGMDYADFVISEIHGLRIKELMDAKKEGRKVIGTFCLYVPEEIVLAADAVCVGLCAGADIGTEKAETMLPRNTCALIKSFFGFKLENLCPYTESCDLIIGETTCDGKKKAYEIFNELKETFVIEIPQIRNESTESHWKSELRRLTAKIEEITGNEITAEKLQAAVKTVNEKRKALARLNKLRAADPAPISGRDALLLNQVQFYDDPVRFTEKLNALCDELEKRVEEGVGVAEKGTPRILVSGCPMAAPNWKVPFVIETSGAVIVGEESCVGERGTRNLVSEEGTTKDEIIELIAERYLKINCASFTPNPGRLEDIERMYREYNAQGVIHYALAFCGTYTTESYLVDKLGEEKGIPVLQLETDYGMGDVEQLQIRVQSFLEMLKAKV